MLPVDAAGTPLMNAVLYGVDGRATTEVEELTAAIGVERLLARTGNALTSQSVGPKILWLRRNRPEVWARTARLHTSTSFLVERLTGESVIDHYSAAGFGPLYDVERREWSAELRGHRAAANAAATRLVGGDRRQDQRAAAAATGLSAGTPVAFGTIDAAAEALSVGVRGAGDTMLMYGSTVFVIALTDAPVRDARLWYAPWLFPGCTRRWRASRPRAR